MESLIELLSSISTIVCAITSTIALFRVNYIIKNHYFAESSSKIKPITAKSTVEFVKGGK